MRVPDKTNQRHPQVFIGRLGETTKPAEARHRRADVLNICVLSVNTDGL